MGYRWYDYHRFEPMYPFGHGLSYTTFKYDDESLKVDERNISITVTNSGNVTGKEVV
jgi:beta-glucosidase